MKNMILRPTLALLLGSCLSLPAYALIAPTPDSGSLESEGDQLEFTGGPIIGANASPPRARLCA